MICAICDRDPCLTPSFCAACRDADRRKARGEPPRCAPLRPAPPPMVDLPKANLEGKSWKEIAAEAWDGPGWRQAALEYHHGRGERTLTVETPPESLKRLRRLLESNVSLERAYRETSTLRGRAAASTVEALMFELRGGTKALSETAVTRRLSVLSEQQLHEVCGRLQRLVITRAWTPDEIATLVDKWNGCHG